MSEYFHHSARTIQRFKAVQRLLDSLQPGDPPKALLVPDSPEPSDNIIVFPGSFNPPTNAHLALLKSARRFGKQHPPTQLFAALSKHIVDKENVERPLLVDRIMLLETVLHHHLRDTGIMLFNRGLYVEQAEAVHASFPRVKRLFFLIGFDKIMQILDPRYYDDRDAALRELFALAELLVAPRGKDGAKELEELLGNPENFPFAKYIHNLPLDAAYRNISSTEIRESADAHLLDVPREVRDFMQKTRAYMSPVHMEDGTEIDYYGERMKILNILLHSSSRVKNGDAEK